MGHCLRVVCVCLQYSGGRPTIIRRWRPDRTRTFVARFGIYSDPPPPPPTHPNRRRSHPAKIMYISLYITNSNAYHYTCKI